MYILFLCFIEGLKKMLLKQPQVADTRSRSNEDTWLDGLRDSRRANMFEQLPLFSID